jgi:peptidoglycan/LPS O-acetylase OafA/YrhL
LKAVFVLVLTFETTIPTAIVAGASAPLILAPIERPIPVLSLLGTISYSLYLIHTLIGNRIAVDRAWRIRRRDPRLAFGGGRAVVFRRATLTSARRMIKVRGGVRVWEQQ